MSRGRPAGWVVASAGWVVATYGLLVRPWHRRAGRYSYWIDNDFRPSPDRIVPELQHLDAGDMLRTGRDGGFTVTAVETTRYRAGLIEGELGQISVVQHLEPMGGDKTRLVIRVRASFALRPAAWAFWLAFDAGDFVMMRKEMLGIKRRVEHHR